VMASVGGPAHPVNSIIQAMDMGLVSRCGSQHTPLEHEGGGGIVQGSKRRVCYGFLRPGRGGADPNHLV
jgi:hypothetical protein